MPALQPIVFPDIELTLTGILRAALAARSEPVAAGVYIGNQLPSTMPDKAVTIRRDGGPQLDLVRDSARVGINVYGQSVKQTNDLAALVRALLYANQHTAPLLRVDRLTGPSPVNGPGEKPQVYLTGEVVVRGAPI